MEKETSLLDHTRNILLTEFRRRLHKIDGVTLTGELIKEYSAIIQKLDEIQSQSSRDQKKEGNCTCTSQYCANGFCGLVNRFDSVRKVLGDDIGFTK